MKPFSTALTLVAAFGMSSATLAQQARPNNPFKVPPAYLDQLRGRGAGAPVSGPAEFTLERKSGETVKSEVAPIARLQAMLKPCRGGGFSANYGKPGAPAWIEGNQSFECLGAGAEDKSVYVTVTTADGQSIESVRALLGGPVYWTPPSPGMGAQPGYDETEFQRNREVVRSFFTALMQEGGPALSGPQRPATIVYRGEREPKPAPVSLDRLRQLLKGCKNDWETRSVLQFDGVTHRGTNIIWKCDARSSAWGDMTSAIGVKDGAVDFIGISPMLDYPVPPAE
jgi:hypothetical protein